MKMDILLLEDHESDIESCKSSLERFHEEHPENVINLLEAKTPSDAESFFTNSCYRIEGAIVDLKIGSDQQAGNGVIAFINNHNLRIPIIITTGTPDYANQDYKYAGVHTKGSFDYAEIFSKFAGIQKTGLYDILGQNGIGETFLNEIFQKSIVPYLGKWIDYTQNNSSQDIKRAFMRHILSHAMEKLDGDFDEFFPEECYLHKEQTTFPRPGEIFECNTPEGHRQFWCIITPPCDLAMHKDKNGEDFVKVEHVQLVCIQNLADYRIEYEQKDGTQTDKQSKHWNKFCKSPDRLYLHFLPPVSFFQGGFLNFRTVHTVSIDVIKKQYTPLDLIISPLFFKNILANFSSYYSRQGQPNLKF